MGSAVVRRWSATGLFAILLALTTARKEEKGKKKIAHGETVVQRQLDVSLAEEKREEEKGRERRSMPRHRRHRLSSPAAREGGRRGKRPETIPGFNIRKVDERGLELLGAKKRNEFGEKFETDAMQATGMRKKGKEGRGKLTSGDHSTFRTEEGRGLCRATRSRRAPWGGKKAR